MRQILASIAGLVAGSLVVAAVEALGHAAYPSQAFDLNDPATVKAAVSSLPTGALLFLVAGWTLGAFVGAATALSIARGRPWLHAGIVGGLMLAATIVNFVLLPHPLWLMALGPIGITAATSAAVLIVGARRAP